MARGPLARRAPAGKGVNDIGDQGLGKPAGHSGVPARTCEASIPCWDATVVMRSVHVDCKDAATVHSPIITKDACKD